MPKATHISAKRIDTDFVLSTGTPAPFCRSAGSTTLGNQRATQRHHTFGAGLLNQRLDQPNGGFGDLGTPLLDVGA